MNNMISKEQVKHIAKLAKLELESEEIEKMKEELSEVLNYVNILKEAPKPQKRKKENLTAFQQFRSDVPAKNYFQKTDLISLAPYKKDNYIKVKQVLQHGIQ